MEKIYFKDKKKFFETLEKIKSDGLDKLHILSDFDRTLTKSFVNGEKKSSIISVLRREGYLSKEYRKKAYELYDYYYPIEIDPKIPLEEKKKIMTEWWLEHLKLLVKSKLHKSDVESVATNRQIILRPGVKEFLKNLSENNIPLVIISANGIGTDSISIYLEKEGFLTKNIYIISNSFSWDENGNVTGYDKRVIHNFNKGEEVLKDYPEIYEKIKDRKNVILLGDSLGDPDMINGFDYKNCLKIGFLNENEDELLEVYKEKYDVVLTGDSDGEFLNEI